MGGRLTLVNSVLSALPLYYLSFFKLPCWVIKKIDVTRSKFFWSGSRNTSSTFGLLVNWDSVCLPKSEGGLGVLNLKLFNTSLWCKWLWKALTKESSSSKVVFFVH